MTATLTVAPCTVRGLSAWLRGLVVADIATDRRMGDTTAVARSFAVVTLIDQYDAALSNPSHKTTVYHVAVLRGVLIVLAQGYRTRDGFRPEWHRVLPNEEA